MIVTRASKNSALTYAELDGNFTDLDARTTTAWVMDGIEPSVPPTDPLGAGLNIFRDGLYAYTYYDGQVTQSFSNWDVPFNWAPGTDLYAAIHWSPGNFNAVGTVRFGLEFTYASINETFGSSNTIYIQSAANGTPYKHYQAMIDENNKFPAALIQPNTRFLIRIFRDGEHVNDTFDGDIYIIGIDFYYQVNRFGTSTRVPPYV